MRYKAISEFHHWSCELVHPLRLLKLTNKSVPSTKIVEMRMILISLIKKACWLTRILGRKSFIEDFDQGLVVYLGESSTIEGGGKIDF